MSISNPPRKSGHIVHKGLQTALIASLLVAAGCGSNSAPDEEPSGGSEQVSGKPVQEWNALSKDFNGLATALNNVDQAKTSELLGDPKAKAADVSKAIGYDFAKGNALEEWKPRDSGLYFCLSGSESTYLTFSATAEGLNRALGTGECNYDTGDITTTISAPSDAATGQDKPSGATEKVTKGKDLASKIPSLKDNPLVARAGSKAAAESTGDCIEDDSAC